MTAAPETPAELAAAAQAATERAAQYRADPGTARQPDIIDPRGEAEEPMLVDTPESRVAHSTAVLGSEPAVVQTHAPVAAPVETDPAARAAPRPRTRKPKPKADAAPDTATDSASDTTDAAE